MKFMFSITALSDRLITSKDHASVQISVADVDADGLAQSTSTTFALCGQVRSQGEGDDSINRLATKAGRTPNAFLPWNAADHSYSTP
jgi:small subunit ribosomal protein S21e